MAAAASIRAFQEAERSSDVRHERDGIVTRTLRLPVDRAGCYVPGGRAVYPSTVLMTVVPAKVAGVAHVAVCVPPGPDGAVPDVVLAAAAIAGADAVYPIGGAQAVAALAYGTESIPAVDVIVGPGNVYVAVAKREVAGEGRVGVPSAFAGPSEVVVVADAGVPASHAAIDIVVQAEHGPGGLAWLVTWDAAAADAIVAEVARLARGVAPASRDRVDARANGRCVLVDDAEPADRSSPTPSRPSTSSCSCADAEELVRARAPRRRGLRRAVLAGIARRLLRRTVPRAPDVRLGALRRRPHARRLHEAGARDRRSTAAGFAAAAPHVIALAEAEGLAAHADSIRCDRTRRDRAPRRRRAHARLPLAPGRRGRASQHQRGAVAAAPRLHRARWPTAVADVDMAPLSRSGGGRAATATRRSPRHRSRQRSSPPTGPTRCSRPCASPMAGTGVPSPYSNRRTRCTATSPASPAPRWSTGERADDFTIDLDEVASGDRVVAAGDHVPLLAEQPDRHGRRPGCRSGGPARRRPGSSSSTRPTASSPRGRRLERVDRRRCPRRRAHVLEDVVDGGGAPRLSASPRPGSSSALEKVVLPYHLDAVKQAAGRLALDHEDEMRARVAVAGRGAWPADHRARRPPTSTCCRRARTSSCSDPAGSRATRCGRACSIARCSSATARRGRGSRAAYVSRSVHPTRTMPSSLLSRRYWR